MSKILDLYMRSVPYIDSVVEIVSTMPTDAVHIYLYPIFRHGIRDELYISLGILCIEKDIETI